MARKCRVDVLWRCLGVEFRREVKYALPVNSKIWNTGSWGGRESARSKAETINGEVPG